MHVQVGALGYEPTFHPKHNFKEKWIYDKELYKQRNKIEEFFRRLKRFSLIFTRYDKLDIFLPFYTSCLDY